MVRLWISHLTNFGCHIYRSDRCTSMPFEAIPKTAIAEDIVAQLLLLIREKKLLPGDKLPPESELAAMMGVSRPSLREALPHSLSCMSSNCVTGRAHILHLYSQKHLLSTLILCLPLMIRHICNSSRPVKCWSRAFALL